MAKEYLYEDSSKLVSTNILCRESPEPMNITFAMGKDIIEQVVRGYLYS